MLVLKKKYKLKNKLIVFFCIIFFVFLLVRHNIDNSKRSDITYSAEQYLTTGFFNSYKLYNVDYYHLIFSDTKNAILEVQGMEYKVPHKTVKYRMIMHKDNNGLWNVNRLEPLSDVEDINETN